MGKQTIIESLESFVQGEVLDGENKYHCDQCDAKVAALKRTCLKQSPAVLVLQLKRMEFDMEVWWFGGLVVWWFGGL